jgi:hypothetical protein
VDPFRDDTDFAAELRALRPTPRPAFAAELDDRAAAGFPRRSSDAISPLSRFLARIRTTEPRRALIPAGSFALAAIVAATVVVAVNEPKTDSASLTQLSSTDRRPASSPAARHHASGASAGVQYEAAIPSIAGHNPKLETFNRKTFNRNLYSAGTGSTASSSSTGPFASKARHREVERAAQIILGTTPSEVHEVAGKILQTVHAYQGIVLRSSIHDVGEADSTFDLLIPSTKLSDALAEFSEAGEVLSRRESTADVTARTVGLGERLQDTEATIKGLLGQLATTETDSEREVLEAELASGREHVAGLRARLSSLQRRVHFSRVSLRIDSKPGAVAGGNSNHWGLSDALDDAGHILAIAAGVIIVGLAILAPLALIAFLACLVNQARVRRGRERALR